MKHVGKFKPEEHTNKCHCGQKAKYHVMFGSGCGNVCKLHKDRIVKIKGQVEIEELSL